MDAVLERISSPPCLYFGVGKFRGFQLELNQRLIRMGNERCLCDEFAHDVNYEVRYWQKKMLAIGISVSGETEDDIKTGQTSAKVRGARLSD